MAAVTGLLPAIAALGGMTGWHLVGAVLLVIVGIIGGPYLKGLPAMKKTQADSDAKLREDLLARIEKLEARSTEQDKKLVECEARDTANRGKIDRVMFCARVLAEELPIDNRVRMQVDALLKGDWSLPPTPMHMAALVAKLDDPK